MLRMVVCSLGRPGMLTPADTFPYIRHYLVVVVFIFLFLPISSQAQQYRREVDSLRTIWYSAPGAFPDSVRFIAGSKLMKRYSAINYDSMLPISQEMDEYGRRTGNRLWRAEANCRQAKYYYLKTEVAKARSIYQKALVFLDDERNPIAATCHLGIARTFGHTREADSCFYHLNYAKELALRYGFKGELGHIYGGLAYYSYTIGNKYVEALDYYAESMKVMQVSYQGRLWVEMGNVFSILGLNADAKECYEKSLDPALRNSTPSDLVNAYAAMINLRPTIREADLFLQKGDSIAEKNNLSVDRFELAFAAAAFYLDSLQLEKAAKCLQVSVQSSSPISFRLQSPVLYARLYQLQGRYQQSLNVCLKVRPLLEEAKLQAQLLTLYDLIGKNYEALGQPTKALYYERKREVLEKELNNRQVINDALSTYVRRITEKEKAALESAKESAERLTAETRSNARLVYILLSLLSFFLAVAVAIYYKSYQQKKRAAAKLENANRQLEQEQNRLKQSNQKLQRFTGVVSHDILSNLDLILSTGNILVGNKPKPESLVKYYKMSQQTSTQLKTYCLDLLQEARQPNLATGHTPNPVLQAVYHRYEPSLQAKNFRVDLDPLPPYPLPPVVMEQLFQNLISNVLRHADTAESPWLHIGGGTDEQGRLYLMVEDNGPGIPEYLSSTIFQGNTSNINEAGQKLGLYLLKQTLQAYNADISATQRPGGGARFVCTFA